MTVAPRESRDWGSGTTSGSPADLDILVPSYRRPAELAVTLAGLAGQSDADFGVVIADQSSEPVWGTPAVAAMVRVLEAQGRDVRCRRNLPRRGLAHQRQYLLESSTAGRVLFLDADVWLEPGTVSRMLAALADSGAGFIGSAVQGLSYLEDRRPGECAPLELWDGPVTPEPTPDRSPARDRWTLHNAANPTHLAADLELGPDDHVLYKVAWVGGCVLYDREALDRCGGFGFWKSLPPDHAGEDVLAQWRVMARYGGAGVLPSGAVHIESPTTVTDRSVEATVLFDSDPPR